MSNEKLPKKYQILPFSIEFSIPNFNRYKSDYDRTLALVEKDCEVWFNEFIDLVKKSITRKYLPICRLSDGEFLFLCGPQKRYSSSFFLRFLYSINHLLKTRIQKRDFEAKTKYIYHSGKYTQAERANSLNDYIDNLREISLKGVLAFHFSYGKKPFQEHYFPELKEIISKNNISLKNYYPFYFVYAMLLGPKFKELFSGKRILLVHSADDSKKERIEKTLHSSGVLSISWIKISSNRSLYDKICVSDFLGKVDVAFIGAGIGKPNILMQMEVLNVPCIDAGYAFEVWDNRENVKHRAFCEPDN
jgi:hypothetical protein